MKLSKRLLILALAVCLALGTALPALASSQGSASQPALQFKADKDKADRPAKKVQVVKGEVTAIAGDVITINDTPVTVAGDTRYQVPGLGKTATVADIKVGMNVVAQTQVDGVILRARQIADVPKRPVYSQHSGNVTAFNYAPASGGNITIQDKAGKIVTFEIIAGKFKVQPKDAEVKVGVLVTVISHRDPAQNRLIASGVVVHPPRPLPLQQVSGVITGVNEIGSDNGTITINTTVLKYDARTVFALRGVGLAVKVGQPATAFYRELADHTLLAKRVVVGARPPKPLKVATQSRNTKSVRTDR